MNPGHMIVQNHQKMVFLTFDGFESMQTYVIPKN